MSMKILFKNNYLSVENPRVTGSIPVSATNKIKLTVMWAFFTPTGFENFLQRLTVLTMLRPNNKTTLEVVLLFTSFNSLLSRYKFWQRFYAFR